MPFARAYNFARRWKRKRLNRRAIFRTAGRVAYGTATRGLPLTLASEAKRFITDLGNTAALGTAVNLANPYRIVLTEIPRNISGTDPQESNRVGRKIWIKGVTLKTMFTQSLSGQTSGCRIILVRQLDPAEDFRSTINAWGPVGSTRGIKVLYDKTFVLNALNSTDNGVSNRIVNRYVKVNKTLMFDGDVNDGTDTDSGTLVLYNLNTDANGHRIHGAITVHYREML